jgi:hypothetical protein
MRPRWRAVASASRTTPDGPPVAVADGGRVESSQERFIGTGRANLTGGTATITTPKEVVELLDIGEDGRDLVYFEDEGKIILVPSEEVTLR